ncbi:chromate transporter [Planomicrobium koreense]|uniref:Chromate transporter n=2 Tax=Caryophanaceae TaxID=186818 RepID=A0A7W8CSE3_9BACL|nr:chromate transporter [Planococcus koreensis]
MVTEGKKGMEPRAGSALKINADLFAAFFRVGILGFGGGPSAIPLFHAEAVKKYDWMTEDEFSDTLALANTMPGPIATKMAGYIGYRIGGIVGSMTALIALVVPTVLMMILLLGALQQFKGVEWVNSMSAAVVPVVAVMLGVMTWDFVKKSGQSLGWPRAALLLGISVLLMEILHIHPVVLIIGILLIVLLGFRKGGRTA